MNREFEGYGIRLRYPRTWELVEERNEEQRCVSITITSPETSFWSLTLFFSRPTAANLLESALQAFREEYAEIDFYPAESHLCRRENFARDLDFVCLDLLSSAFLRSFETERFTALVLYQGADADLENTRGMLEGISESLYCEFAER